MTAMYPSLYLYGHCTTIKLPRTGDRPADIALWQAATRQWDHFWLIGDPESRARELEAVSPPMGTAS